MSAYLFMVLSAIIIGALLAAAIINDTRATMRRLDSSGIGFGGRKRKW